MDRWVETIGLVSVLHTTLCIITGQSWMSIFSIVGYIPVLYQRTLPQSDYPFQNNLHLLYHTFNTFTFVTCISHCLSLFLQTGLPNMLIYPQGPFNAALINQKSLYEITSILCGCGYALYRIFNNKDVLVYTPIQTRLWFRIKSLAYTSIQDAFTLSLYVTFSYLVFYLLFGQVLLYQVTTVARLFGYKLAKQSFSFLTPISIGLQYSTYVRLVRCVACWEFLHSLYNMFMTLPRDLDLKKGFTIQKSEKIPQFFALYYHIQTSHQFRHVIFDDISTEPLLKKVGAECLEQLREMTTSIKNHSGDDKQFKKEKIETIQNDSRNAYRYQKHQQSKKLEIQKGGLVGTQTGSIFINRKKSALDTAMSYLVEEEKQEIPVQQEMDEKGPVVPTVLLPVQQPPTVTLSMELGKDKKLPGSIDFVKAVSGLLEKLPLGSWVLQDTIQRESMLVFKDIQVCIWSCSVLGKLFLSTNQDKYAQLSQLVPRVLEILLDLHSSIELWIKKKQSSSKPLEIRLLHEETCPPILKPFVSNSDSHVISLPYTMLQVVEQTVYQVIGTFYTSMDRYRFDSQYVEKLQRFMDFAQ